MSMPEQPVVWRDQGGSVVAPFAKRPFARIIFGLLDSHDTSRPRELAGEVQQHLVPTLRVDVSHNIRVPKAYDRLLRAVAFYALFDPDVFRTLEQLERRRLEKEQVTTTAAVVLPGAESPHFNPRQSLLVLTDLNKLDEAARRPAGVGFVANRILDVITSSARPIS